MKPQEPDIYGSCPNSEDTYSLHSRYFTFDSYYLCHSGLRICPKIAEFEPPPLTSLQPHHFVGTLAIPISTNNSKDIFWKHDLKWELLSENVSKSKDLFRKANIYWAETLKKACRSCWQPHASELCFLLLDKPGSLNPSLKCVPRRSPGSGGYTEKWFPKPAAPLKTLWKVKHVRSFELLTQRGSKGAVNTPLNLCCRCEILTQQNSHYYIKCRV